MKTTRVVSFLLLTLVLAACGGGQVTDPAPSPAEPVNVTGTWQGTATIDGFLGTLDTTFVLSESSDGSVSGSAVLTLGETEISGDAFSPNVSSSLVLNVIAFIHTPQGAEPANFTFFGALTDTTYSGGVSYESPEDGTGGSGQFSVTKSATQSSR